MDLGSLLLVLALLVLVGLFVARPLFERKAIPVPALAEQEDQELSTLLAERDRILNALQELDFDRDLGKVPEPDYPAQRAALLQRGAEVLRRLDERRARASAGDLEAAIASRRLESGRGAAPRPARRPSNGDGSVLLPVPVGEQAAAGEDDLEALLAARRRERHEKAAGFCPQCGQPIRKTDRFCPKCGATLA